MDKTSSVKNSRKADCFSCIYHRITWEKDHPYACTAMGFKSRIIPSMEVFKVSGTPCVKFTPKPGKK